LISFELEIIIITSDNYCVSEGFSSVNW